MRHTRGRSRTSRQCTVPFENYKVSGRGILALHSTSSTDTGLRTAISSSWNCHIFRYASHRPISSRCFPESAIAPFSTTRMRSAHRIVAGRWETTTRVRPCPRTHPGSSLDDCASSHTHLSASSALVSRPLDWGLLWHTITIAAERGQVISGRIAIDKCERCWSLTPASPWPAGRYRIRVESSLEDVCGNSLTGPFDQPIRKDRPLRTEMNCSSLMFELV
jgi:hypothetical protein